MNATERQIRAEQAAALREAAAAIAGSVPINFQLRPDGSTDPLAAAYVEGLGDAHGIVNELAEKTAPPEPEEEVEVVDLVAALRASVEAAKARRKARGEQ